MSSDQLDDEAEVAEAGTLSFIDVVSCGLAAALLLFLVYTVLPHMGRSGSIRANVTSMYARPGFERNVAGLARDEKSAKLAITVMSVSVELPAKGAPPAAWLGLPRDCHQHVLRAKTRWMFVATCIKGVPPDTKVTLALADPTRDSRTIAVKASLFVGGGDEIPADCNLFEDDTKQLAEFLPSSTNCLVSTHGAVKAN